MQETIFLSSFKNEIDRELSTNTDNTGFIVCNSTLLMVGLNNNRSNKKILKDLKQNNKTVFFTEYFSL